MLCNRTSAFTILLMLFNYRSFAYSVCPIDRYKTEKKEEKHLIQTIAANIRTHNYHTTAYINQKYATIL